MMQLFSNLKIFDLLILSLCFIILAIASVTDIKKREVPDWLSYASIATGFGVRLLASIVYWEKSYFVEGLVGFAIFFVLAIIMFYAGLWGGGDSKVLMALGVLLGLKFEFLPFIVVFFLISMIVGSFYGIIFSSFLAIKNRKHFVERFVFIWSDNKIKNYKKIVLIYSLMSVLSVLIAIIFLVLGNLGIIQLEISEKYFVILIALLGSSFMAFTGLVLYVFSKSVEETCMQKNVSPEKLTEGDWIVNDIIVEGEKICGPKDLGIDKTQIEKLIQLKKQKKITKILIKEGMPFIPSFFIAFILTVLFRDKIVILLQSLV